jgi:hypothetical protein
MPTQREVAEAFMAWEDTPSHASNFAIRSVSDDGYRALLYGGLNGDTVPFAARGTSPGTIVVFADSHMPIHAVLQRGALRKQHRTAVRAARDIDVDANVAMLPNEAPYYADIADYDDVFQEFRDTHHDAN